MKKIFKIDPLKSFIELPILWIIVAMICFISFIIALFITYNSKIIFSFDYEGINLLITVYKLPLTIFALIIPFVAILATTHRSVQTKEQIINSNNQNNFSNYYKHIEEFEKFINLSINEKSIHINNIRICHKSLFPKSKEGNYSVCTEYINLIESEYANCVSLLEKFNSDEQKSIFNIFYEIYLKIDNVYSKIGIKISRSGRRFVENGKVVVIPDLEIKSFFSHIKDISSIIVQILSFDQFVKIPNSLNKIINLNDEVVPKMSIMNIIEIERFNVFDNNS